MGIICSIEARRRRPAGHSHGPVGVRLEMYAGVGRRPMRRSRPSYRPPVSRPTLASDRLRALDPRVFDAVLTVGLTILGVASQFAEGPSTTRSSGTPTRWPSSWAC